MLKSFKNKLKNAKKAAAQAPRDLSALQAEHSQLSAKAGQVQYQIYIYEKELQNLNSQLENVNYEAAARQQLDKDAKPEVKEEVK